MPNFDELLKDKQAAGLLKNTAKLEHLRDAPETRRVFDLLSRSAGGDLEQAAQRAAQGDSAQLTDAIRKVMGSPEGARLIRKMQESMK